MHDFNKSIDVMAEDFYKAYKRCKRGENPQKMLNSCVTKYDALNVPAIVMASFAIELFLKSILSKERKGEKIFGHDFVSLFSLLSTKSQNYIKMNVSKLLYGTDSFDDALQGINNAFCFWRYIHEKEDFGYGLNKTLMVLPAFMETIRNLSKSLLSDTDV